jgi:hypothetical protein
MIALALVVMAASAPSAFVNAKLMRPAGRLAPRAARQPATAGVDRLGQPTTEATCASVGVEGRIPNWC